MMRRHGTASKLATRSDRGFMRKGRRRCHRASAGARNAARRIGHSDPTPDSARTPVGNALIAGS